LTLDAEGRLLDIDVEQAENDGDDSDADVEDHEDGHHEHSYIDAKAQGVELGTLPKAAQLALGEQAGKANIEEVEREEKHGHVLYEAMWKINGVKHEATVTANGVVLNLETVATAESVPVDVRKTTKKSMNMIWRFVSV